jgi:hypothetical protein
MALPSLETLEALSVPGAAPVRQQSLFGGEAVRNDSREGRAVRLLGVSGVVKASKLAPPVNRVDNIGASAGPGRLAFPAES